MEKRQYSLDFVKVIATVFILFHHYQQFISGMFDKGINYYGGVYNFGMMVELFFILSGYFMYPYIKKIREGLSFKNFFLTRYIRLIPLVAIAAFGYQFLTWAYIKVEGTAWFMQYPNFWETIVAALGFQEGWVFRGNINVNYPVWYVSVLLLCYAIFYIVTLLSKKLHISARYFYLAFIFIGIAINSYGWSFLFMNAYTARGYYAFFTGILMATYCFDRESTQKETLVAFAATVMIIWLIVCYNAIIGKGVEYISTFILFPAVIVLFKNPLVSKVFSHKVNHTAASIAFNSYIWQMPLLIMLLFFIQKVPTGINFLSRGSMWGFVLFAIAAGAISHFVIEKNVQKLINKLMKR